MYQFEDNHAVGTLAGAGAPKGQRRMGINNIRDSWQNMLGGDMILCQIERQVSKKYM